MTRKDYKAVAEAISRARQVVFDTSSQGSETRYAALTALDMAHENLAVAFARDNPRFAPSRFLAACRTPFERSEDVILRKAVS